MTVIYLYFIFVLGHRMDVCFVTTLCHNMRGITVWILMVGLCSLLQKAGKKNSVGKTFLFLSGLSSFLRLIIE